MAYYFRAARATNSGVRLARHGMDHYRGSDYYTFAGRPAAAQDTAAWSIMTKLLGSKGIVTTVTGTFIVTTKEPEFPSWLGVVRRPSPLQNTFK